MNRILRRIRNRFRHARRRNPNFDDDDDDDDVYDDDAAYVDYLDSQGRIADYYHVLSLYARMDLDVDANLRRRREDEKSPLPPALEETPHSTPERGENGESMSDLSPEKEMLKELTCPVCGLLYTDPVMSSCLHSLCSACVQTLVSDGNKGKCPVCKEEITPDEMRKNYPLNGIVEVFSRRMSKTDGKTESVKRETQSKKDESHVLEGDKLNTASSEQQTRQCSICDDPPEWFCIQCQLGWCGSCLNGYHPTLESTPEHTLISLNSGTSVVISSPL